jgi:GTPase SAR1 family protein
MQTGNATEQIERVRLGAVDVLQSLAEKGKEFELPEPPQALALYSRKLRANEYSILVVGEAKRGKSTFVNALIGKDTLPTDIAVATSQVFKISSSGEEGYRVRFEDGSQQEISREELPLYGSQVVADIGASPTPNRWIRWIEVDVPVRFLPKGVSILDTPGLGALYANHARITHRFVPEADAVIFVLESGQPVVEDDLTFIQELLGVMRNIFFIQTKIDLFDKETWQTIQRRSQNILSERFKGQLPDPRVWPVSSTNLLKAASDEGKAAEAYLMVSRHGEMEAALQAFLARVAGWSRAAEAMLAAAEYHSTGRKALSGRLGSVASSSDQRTDLQAAAMQHKQRFETEWGLSGQKYSELKEGLKKTIYVGKQSFAKSLRPGGDIDRAQRTKIDKIESLEAANDVAREMPQEIMAMAIKRWSRVCQEVRNRCAELVGPLAEAANDVSAPVEPVLPDLSLPNSGPGDEFKHDYTKMLKGALEANTMLLGVGSMASLAGLSFLWPTLVVVAPFVTVPALAMLARSGFQKAFKGEVQQARQELYARLREVLSHVRGSFYEVNLASMRLSVVDEYFRTVERTMNEQIGDLVRQKSKEANAEITRLTESAKLDAQQRETESNRIRKQLAEWDEIGKATKNVMVMIKALKAAGVTLQADREVAERR